MLLHCLYLGTKYDATLVKTEYVLTCPNLVIDLPKYTPLILEGDYISSMTFNADDISLDTENRQGMENLLAGRGFKGVGPSKAKLILNSLEYAAKDKNMQDYTYLVYEDALQVLADLKIPDDTRFKLVTLITGLHTRVELYHALKKHGGSFMDANSLYQHYQTSSLDILRDSPYRGLECNISFAICDKFAASEKKSDILSPERLDAIGQTLCQMISSDGHCCIELEKALGMITSVQRTGSYPAVNPLTVLNYLCAQKKLVTAENIQYGSLVYSPASYEIEKGIAKELTRISEHPVRLGFWKYSGDWAPDADQMYAISLIQTTGVKIVTGGPGTGKTSVINEMIREFKKHSGMTSVMLCAPTGAAAARINQSIGKDYHATTIHKLLDIREFSPGDYHYTYNRVHQLPRGLFIIDEMSMVSEDLFYRLLLAIPTGSTVILTGDVDQLQSISSGTVLSDLIKSGIFETARLRTIHRQTGQSLIVTNCQHIKNEDGFVETNETFTADLNENSDARLKAIADWYIHYKGKCQILTCSRKGSLGKTRIDELITQAHALDKPQYKKTGFYLGDKIMTIRNNYQKGYFNGDCGIITKIMDDGIAVQFYEGLLILNDEDIVDVEHAWACTVHKSQGNEYDNVIIVLDPEYPGMLYKSLLFTAVSRAKKNVHIISTKKSLKKALTDTTEDKRITGLSGILMEVAGNDII